MSCTIKEAFSFEAVSDAKKLISEYEIVLGDLTTSIKFRVFQPIGSNLFDVCPSHFINTPTQIGSHQPGQRQHDDEAWAIRSAVNLLHDHYSAAIAAGHEPEESWLEENPLF